MRQAALVFFLAVALAFPVLADTHISKSYEFGPLTTEPDGVYDLVFMPGTDYESIPGAPIVPYRAVSLLIPEGEHLAEISVMPEDETCLDGSYHLKPGQEPYPVSYNGTITYTAPNATIYDSDSPYPGIIHLNASVQYFRGYKVVAVKLYPVRYEPKSGRLCYYPNMGLEALTVSVNVASLPLEAKRSVSADRQMISAQVANPEHLGIRALPAMASTQESSPSSLADPSLAYEYVVITSVSLNQSFQPFVSWKNSIGINATIAFVEDIVVEPDYHCDGTFGDGCADAEFNDTQAHIRNFIRDAYANWGTSYVLLGGDDEIIPARGVYAAYGSYVDNSLPSDLYYGCLDGSWNYDNDALFGEYNDGISGAEVDLYAEVYIGRATVDTAAEARNFVNKTIEYYYSADDPYIKTALMVGEELDELTWGGDNKDYVAREIRKYNISRMYDRDGTFSKSNVAAKMNAGIHIINHGAHSSKTRVMGMYSSDVAALTNDQFFFLYTWGCYTNAFDTAESGTSEAISEHFILNPGGAFAYIGNTRYGWYLPGSVFGTSDYYDMEFFDALIDENITRLGPALEDSRQDKYSSVGPTGTYRWIYFDLALLGDPHLSLKTDIPGPVAFIVSPAGGSTEDGSTSITGTALGGGAGMANYSITIGAGTDPAAWSGAGITLQNGGAGDVSEGTLANWDTSLFQDGTVTIKLLVEDIDGKLSEDRVILTVDNSYLDSPGQDTFLRGGDTLPLRGTVSQTSFHNYWFEFGQGASPSSWSRDGITLANGGMQEVSGSLLAAWNTENITAADYYTIRLTINNTGFNYSESTIVVIDPDFQQGWPQRVTHRLLAASVGVGDVDNDGFLEIAAGESRLDVSGGRDFYLWHSNGSNYSGWPKDYVTGEYIRSSPLFADVDGDRDMEVFVGTGSGSVSGWHHNGSIVQGWPSSDPGDEVYTPIAAGDIDDDGDLELVAGSLDNYLYAWHHNGTKVTNWPLMGGSNFARGVALSDLNGDGEPEIIAGNTNGYLYVMFLNKSYYPGWPISLGVQSPGDAVVADLDSDGNPEIVLVSTTKAYVFHSNASNMTGWPVDLMMGRGAPAIGDLDGDSDLEIVLNGYTQVHALHHDGSPVSGWPKSISGASDGSPVIGDIDGDSRPEILIGTDYDSDDLYAWHHNGSPVTGWPKILPTPGITGQHSTKRSTPVIADIDQDDDVEVILGDEDYLLVWDLPGKYNPYNVPWPRFQHDERYSGVYSTPVVPPKIYSIECYANNTWISCSETLFGSNISKVRANCTDLRYSNVTNVTFTLGNLDDSRTFFSNMDALNDSGFWVYDNGDVQIQDSGSWSITVTCSDAEGLSDEESVAWQVGWGILSTYQIEPLANLGVTGNSTFNFSTGVKCMGGECGNVTATLDPSVKSVAVNDASRTSVTMNGATGNGGTSDHRNYIYRTGSNVLYLYDINGTSITNYSLPYAFNDIACSDSYLYGVKDSSPYLVKMHLNGSLVGTYSAESAAGIAYDRFSGLLWLRTSGSAVKSYTAEGVAEGQTLSMGLGGTYGMDYHNGLFCTASNSMTDIDIWNESGVKLDDTAGGGVDDDMGCAFISSGGTNYIFALEGTTVSRYTYSCDGCDIAEPGYSKGVIPMNSGTPFYTTDQNPVTGANLSCLRNMMPGDSCNQSWSVAATGNRTHYEFFVIYSSAYSGVAENETAGINVTILNAPPVLLNLTVTSTDSMNRTNGTLAGGYAYLDVDGDPENHTEAQWKQNGVRVSSLDNLSIVGSGNTTMGEDWTFLVRAHDGMNWSMWHNATITIINTPPAAANVSLLPESPGESDNLTCSYDYSDLDGDSENSSIIRWHRDGAEVPGLQNQAIIANLSPGQTWLCEVIPFDSFDFGLPQNSTERTIASYWTLPLLSGWNLISLPVEADNMSPSALFASLPNFTRAWMFNASDGNPWRLYDPNGLPFLNTLTLATREYGYWINAAGGVQLNLTGQSAGGLNAALRPGWNLMGYPFASPRPAIAAVSSLPGFSRMWAYNSSAQSPWKLYDPNSLPFLNTLANLDPGSGYWVSVANATAWALS
ncbi:MAG: C25 family cysteine peptidase [archaeon]